MIWAYKVNLGIRNINSSEKLYQEYIFGLDDHCGCLPAELFQEGVFT